MPRPLETIKVLALEVGNMQTMYITEHRTCYGNSHRFMCCALLEPHKERYDVRRVRFDSWSKEDICWNDLTEEEFDQYFNEVKSYDDVWAFVDVKFFQKAFNELFIRGGSLWD